MGVNAFLSRIGHNIWGLNHVLIIPRLHQERGVMKHVVNVGQLGRGLKIALGYGVTCYTPYWREAFTLTVPPLLVKGATAAEHLSRGSQGGMSRLGRR